MPMPKRKPQSMSAKGEETAVIVSIIAAVTEVAPAAQILRGRRSMSFPHRMRNSSAVAADTLKKYEAARPSSPASCTKVSCPASVSAKSAADAAKSMICGFLSSAVYERRASSFSSASAFSPTPAFGSLRMAIVPKAISRGKKNI
ncbi:hypothetical protein SDC9_183504 [bioreactor metagenome]|uniref:Uncharacterized protein n=1 Tax=bioreactor metagenome TaxID=1076179 RepID=A0A645HCZ6_9ZZZZ